MANSDSPQEYLHHEMVNETHCRSFVVVEKSAYDKLMAAYLDLLADGDQMDYLNGKLKAELKEKIDYWEKHHMDCHDKWRREKQLLKAEAEKLAKVLGPIANNIYRPDFDAKEALANWNKFWGEL